MRKKIWRWGGVLLLVFWGAVGAGCKKRPERPVPRPDVRPVYDEVVRQAPRPPDVPSEIVPIDTGRPNVPAGEEQARVDALLADVTTRQKCNIVMGCPAAEKLVAVGSPAVGPIIARYRKMARPRYQKFHLLELLGRIGDFAAVPFLKEELSAHHWNARANAAIALGRMGATNELPWLEKLLETTREGQDFGVEYAAAYAVEKLGGEGGREVLVEAVEPPQVLARNWGYTRLAVALAAELGYAEICPYLPASVQHQDLFLQKEAMAAALALDCQSEALERAVATRLSSRVPSVRRAARNALVRWTGRSFDSFEAWQAASAGKAAKSEAE